MTQLSKQVNIYELNGRKHLSLILGFCVVLLALTYLYLINARVYEGYKIAQISDILSEGRVSLQSLESAYLSRTGDIGREALAHLGFVSAEVKFLRVPSGMAMADSHIQ